MPRAKNLPAAKRRKKKVLEASKGFWGMRGNVITVAKHHVMKIGSVDLASHFEGTDIQFIVTDFFSARNHSRKSLDPYVDLYRSKLLKMKSTATTVLISSVTVGVPPLFTLVARRAKSSSQLIA